MKLVDVTKLYAKMTATQQADLIINAMTRHDSAEVEAIRSQVSKGVYRIYNPQVMAHLRHFEAVSLHYGLTFWKLHAVRNGLQNECDSETVAAHTIACKRLASLEAALLEICDKKGFDLQAVRWLSGWAELLEIPHFLATDEFVNEYAELFNAATGS